MKRKGFLGLIITMFLLAILLPLISGVTVHAAGPSATTWYFAEGRVGGGFHQWLSVYNPGPSACAVQVKEYYQQDNIGAVNNTNTVSFTVPANTRYTDDVNTDLSIAPTSPIGATLSATVSVTGATPTCAGVVVERPMYFSSFHGVNSGTDVLGATKLSTVWYFADVPTGIAGESFLSIFNPGDVAANVTVSYYNNGTVVKTDSMSVQSTSRATFQPSNDLLPAHVSAIVTSDRPIMVERPSYFVSEYGVAGSADITGASTLANDWLFAEGNTAIGGQENLTIANLGATSANVTITLKSLSGVTMPFTLTLAPDSQTIWSVNSNNTFPGATSEVAAEVKSDVSSLVVQREEYNVYTGSTWATSQGITDAVGANAPQTNFAFAEGFTSTGFNEWLLLQNPTNAPETITVSLTNMLGNTTAQTYTVAPQSRYTVNITALVASNLAGNSTDPRAYAVSMDISSATGFVAERTMNWSAFGTQGSTSVGGYTGQ